MISSDVLLGIFSCLTIEQFIGAVISAGGLPHLVRLDLRYKICVLHEQIADQ